MKKKIAILTIVFTVMLSLLPASQLVGIMAASNANALTPLTYSVGNYYILSSSLNVRSSATTSSTKVTSISKGQIVKVSSVNGQWGKVTVNDKTGWIDLSYAYSTSNKIDVTGRLNMLRKKFPDGKYWNRETADVNNSDGYTDTPCPYKHSDRSRENYFDGTCQCHGFAIKVGYDIFGIHAANWERHYNINKVMVGDLIRYKNHHTVVVTGVYSDYFMVADCNWDYSCGIDWDRKMMKSYFAFTDDPYDGIYHCPANGGFISGSAGISTTTTKATTTTTKQAVYTTGKVKITGDKVNVRAGAGTNYKIVTTVKKGASYTYTSEKTVSGEKWYYITVSSSTKGWINGKYCTVTQKIGDPVTTTTTKATTTATKQAVYTTGKLKITGDKVNVRSGAGTSYKVVTTVKKGASYTYTSEKTVSGEKWYYITVSSSTKGWINGKYCTVTQKIGSPVTTTTTKSSTTTTATKQAVYTTGKLKITGDKVNVRAGAGTSYKVVTTVKKDASYTYTSEKTVNGEKWYYITVNSSTKGWINGKYCTVTQKIGDPIPTTTVKKVQITADNVNVRSGAGTNYSIITTVKKGSSYTYTETKTVNGTVWYKITLSSSKSGWVVGTYCKTV